MIELTLIAILLGWREVQILCERGSWDFKDFKNWFWFINQSSRWKDFDSFHLINGLTVLVICLVVFGNYSEIISADLWGYSWFLGLFGNDAVSDAVNDAVNIMLAWVYVMWIRNIVMHVILPKWTKGNTELKLSYLIPLIGKWFVKDANG